MKRKDLQAFVHDAQKVQGATYDYSKVVYINDRKKVIIICKLHGEFTQTPNKHLRGRGCPVCGGTQLKTSETFIFDAQGVHGNLYDYSKTNYNGAHKKVSIKCKIHDEFLQRPNDHLNNHGCPICKESKGETLIAQLLDGAKVRYRREVSFPDLSGDTLPLRFDFALFRDNKLSHLLEYDGEQHFKYYPGFHKSKEVFELHQKYDKLKDKYCKKHNIKLIRVSYKCKDAKEYLLGQLGLAELASTLL